MHHVDVAISAEPMTWPFSWHQKAKIEGDAKPNLTPVDGEVSHSIITSRKQKLSVKSPKALKSPEPLPLLRAKTTKKHLQSIYARQRRALLGVCDARLIGGRGLNSKNEGFSRVIVEYGSFYQRRNHNLLWLSKGFGCRFGQNWKPQSFSHGSFAGKKNHTRR